MKILVATDGSFNAQAALELLGNSPFKTTTDVYVVSVWEEGTQALLPGSLSRERASELVKNAIDKLQQSGCQSASGSNPSGNAVIQILQVADKLHPDFIILGAHSRNSMKEIFVGNVANGVLNKAKNSVLIFRAKHGQNGPLARALVCVDDSPVTDRIFSSLHQHIWQPAAALRIVHVLEPDTDSLSEDPKTDAELCVERMNQRRRKMQEMIDDKIAAHKQEFPNLQVSGEVMEELDAADTILEIEKSWSPDLILMGSHGRQGIERLLLGSVSEKISALASCSVQILR